LGRLDNRVAIVTGAGNGLGRAHALYLAASGASVVVNDLGGSVHGEGTNPSTAEAVVREIAATGGKAVASHHDVADWSQAGELVQTAVEAFGNLHVLINNAGILRDRTLSNLTEAQWDQVIRVHLKGHAAPTAHAMTHWRRQAKDGHEVKASVVCTSSVAGFVGNFGQANYSAAKAGVIALSRVVSLEGKKIGVRGNAVSPSARTRLAQSTPGSDEILAPPSDPSDFDHLDPANVSPLIGWLAEANCPADAQVFHLIGRYLYVVKIPEIAHTLIAEGRWTPEALDRELAGRLVEPMPIDRFFGEVPAIDHGC
jgi:NAD(P)-dependent dehydrogenase (short-subunit alcohol dehydrogenase family)